MDLQSLNIFLGLCRNLHFGRTSEEFHLSNSALSRLVQRLERQVGQPLFHRDNRSVELTEEGKRFREFAIETLANWASLKSDLARSATELTGQLSLFASVTASQMILPDVLLNFRERYPGIHIQLDTGYAINALQKLNEGIDVVVANMTLDSDDHLEKRIITSTPVIAVAHPSMLGAETAVDWAAAPLVLPSHGQLRNNINEWLRSRGIRPNIYAEVAGNEATLSLVALGCGIGFVPQLVLRSSPLADKVSIVESGPRLENFHVGFCTRKRSLAKSAVLRAFWEAIDVHP